RLGRYVHSQFVLSVTYLRQINRDFAEPNVLTDRKRSCVPCALRRRWVVVDLPNCLASSHRFGAKVRQLNINVELVGRRVNTLGHTREWNSCVAEILEFVRACVTLRLPECIEQTDEGRSLTEIIMKIEQLKSAEPRRAQVGFDLFLVTLKLKSPRCLSKLPVLLDQSVRVHRVAKDFVIAGPQVTFELLDDVVIGIRNPLTNFMGDDRHVDVGERFSEVAAKPTGLATQHHLTDTLNGQVVSALGDVFNLFFSMPGAAGVKS